MLNLRGVRLGALILAAGAGSAAAAASRWTSRSP